MMTATRQPGGSPGLGQPAIPPSRIKRKAIQMAKANKASVIDTGADMIEVLIPSGLVLKHRDWEIDTATASPATLAYLLQNGFNQSMVDSAALSNKEQEGKTEDEIAEIVLDKKSKRFDNIVAGTVGTRAGGPRAVGIDKYIKDVAVEWIKKIAAKKGMKMPEGKGAAERLAKIVADYMSDDDRAEAVKVEARSRMDRDQEAAATDFTFAA